MGNRLLTQAVAAALLLTLGVAPARATDVPAPAASEAPAVSVASALSTLVPLRAVAEKAGAVVTWEGDTETVTVTWPRATVVLRIGESNALVNGQPVLVGQPVQLIESRTMVPPAFFALILAKANADEKPDLESTAKAFVEAMVVGKAAPYVEQFSPALRKVLGPEQLQVVVGQMAPFGTLQSAQVTENAWNGIHQNVVVAAQFEKAPIRFTVRFDKEGKIDDMIALPATPSIAPGLPAYADPKAYADQEVVVGEGTFALPATLTTPVGEGPFPAVVLVHGSGPNDRDETAYGTKVFRDLAYGLASRGVAVLRYEKRTLEHMNKFSSIEHFTVQEETIDDALEAVKLLGKRERIDPKRIYVLGHSQGGLVLPRILDQGQGIAGGIMMAGPTSLLDILVEQNRLMAKNGDVPPQQVAFIEGQVAMLRDPNFDPANPPQGFLLGMPYWWQDLVGDESTLAEKQTTPLLILQGGRDFQVPATELEKWQTTLAERKDVAYKLFPKLNHLFTEGEGPISTMAEYMVPANVPAYVVDEIANWILPEQ